MSLPFALLLVVFVATFILRIPLSYGLIAGGIIYLATSDINLSNVSQLIAGGYYSKFILIAVPMFIFSAQIMNSAAITDKMFDFAHALVGRMHGGMAQVNVVNSVIFAGMSGSAVADTSGVGLIEVRAMTKRGYPKAFACAATASSSTVGPIIPPSIPMVIFAYISGTSVGMLFAGGILPGLLLSGMMMVLVWFISKRRGFPREAFPGFPALLTKLLVSIPALMTPAILLGGIYSGVFTPTEAAAVASLYALLLAFLVYRSLGWGEFITMFRNVVMQTGAISLMIGGAFIANYAIAVEGLPQRVALFLLGVTDDALLLLLLINLVFFVMGMFVETVVLQLIMVPVVLPVVIGADIDLVHFGVVIVLNMMIGLSTPPLGVNLFIISALTKTPLRDVIREMWPWLGMMVATLTLLIIFPDIVLFVPRLLGYAG